MILQNSGRFKIFSYNCGLLEYFIKQMMMHKPTLLFISMGELATHLLEAVARTDMFSSIIVASRDLKKAQKRVNNALIGAGIEGYFPQIIAEDLDVHHKNFPKKLRDINPDYIFSAPSLFPWWRLTPSDVAIPFAGYTALHLSLMQAFRDQIAMSGVKSFWIGASFPDVINAMLNRTGYGPQCGIGNVQEPISKIQMGMSRLLDADPKEIEVKLVAQHAFEYFVLNDHEAPELPPYLLKVRLGGKDVTDLAETVLRHPFPFPYDMHFNRVTASSALVALNALTDETEKQIHLPGIGEYVGGYPVLASKAGITINLDPEWSLQQAIAVNEASLKWDGIENMDYDGTIFFTEETQQALNKLLGKTVEKLSIHQAQEQATDLLNALS